jgi:spoIIIJ-associated protein
MKEKRATLEVIAPSVEEAIEKGLADLGLPAEAVEVEILDQGSRGLFGLGSRHARIRLAVKPSTKQASPAEAPQAAAPAPAAQEEKLFKNLNAGLKTCSPCVCRLLVKILKLQSCPGYGQRASRDDEGEGYVSVRYGEADDQRSRMPILIDVRGEDLSILIGRRAETLNALQYISSLIVSKELGRPLSLVIDVEGYRARREGQIRQLSPPDG